MKIFLIGLPGSGKSTIGKLLAEELKIRFIDLDAEIEKRAGKTIPVIFREHGEDYFRDREQEQLLHEIDSPDSFVLATGGGTPCFFDNIQAMNDAGKTIFLDVPTREIVKRIKRTERADRPLLGRVHPDELKDQIETLRTRRLPFFKQAQITMKGVQITPGEIAKAVNA